MATTTSLRPANLAQQKDTLADHLSAILHIRGYAIGVQQTSLVPITDPEPDWYTTLTTNLAAAQKHAGAWTQTLEPAITATIPQSVIEFSTRFAIGTKGVLDVLSASNNQPDVKGRMTILAHLGFIQRHLKQQNDTITGLQKQFTQFQQNAQADYVNLTTSNASIQQAIIGDDIQITTLQGDITTQQAEINADEAAITAAGIAAGVGLFVGVGLIGLGAAAGPAAPFLIGIGAFIMVGSVVEIATVLGVYEKRVAAAQAQLNADQANLQLEQQQVASLTVLNASVTNLVTLNQAMAQSLSDIANWWSTLETKLGAVIQDLTDAGADNSAADWEDLGDDIQAAQADWDDFKSFATNMQNIVTGANVQQVNVQPKAA